MSVQTNHVTDTLTPTTGALSVAGIVETKQTISTSVTIQSGYSATSVGPTTINSGVTVTLPSGSRWVIL